MQFLSTKSAHIRSSVLVSRNESSFQPMTNRFALSSAARRYPDLIILSQVVHVVQTHSACPIVHLGFSPLAHASATTVKPPFVPRVEQFTFSLELFLFILCFILEVVVLQRVHERSPRYPAALRDGGDDGSH